MSRMSELDAELRAAGIDPEGVDLESERKPYAHGWRDRDGRYVVEEFNFIHQPVCITYFKVRGT